MSQYVAIGILAATAWVLVAAVLAWDWACEHVDQALVHPDVEYCHQLATGLSRAEERQS